MLAIEKASELAIVLRPSCIQNARIGNFHLARVVLLGIVSFTVDSYPTIFATQL